MALYELLKDGVAAVTETRFSTEGIAERGDLQRILRDQVHVLAPDVLVVAEEFCDWEESRRRIDLLGLDRDANLVVVELKRTEDGGHMELQALRYAAMISKMRFEQVVGVYQRYLEARGQDSTEAGELILGHLGWDEPEEDNFAQDVRIILASAEFSKELTTSVLWLADRGIDIRCVRLKPYKLDDRLLVDIEQIIPLKEAESYQIRLREKEGEERQARRRRQQEPWMGAWYVNVGEGPRRSWEDCRRYGFLAAGNGVKFSGPLRKLSPEDRIFAYQKGHGYVGYGVVRAAAVPARDFKVDGTPLLDLHLAQPGIRADEDDDELCEWIVAVNWISHVPLAEAKTFAGVFANQNIVCKLRHPETLAFLEKAFDVNGGLAGNVQTSPG